MQHTIKYLVLFLTVFSLQNILAQTSIRLNGTTDYIAIAHDPSLSLTGNFTLEAWIKPNAISGEKTILIKGNNGQCGNYGLFIKDGNLAYVSGGECGWNGRGANSNLQTGIWQHVAVVGASNNLKLYIDGILKDEIPLSTMLGPENTDELWIGRSIFSTTNFFFNGFIDDVRIWNTARTQSDIQSTMNTGLSGLELHLLAYYKLDDIETTCDIEDCTPNENHGTRIDINDNTNFPEYSGDQPGLTQVECGVTFNDCITFLGEFQLFVDSVKLNLQEANANSFLNDVLQVTETIQNLQYYYANRNQIVDAYYDFLTDLCVEFPSFFKLNQTIDDIQFKYLGSLREQVHIYLRDYLRYYPEKENQFITALDLSNPNAFKYLKIWNDHHVLIIDNYSLSNLQLDIVSNLLESIPDTITDLGVVMFRAFYTDDFQNLITTQSVSFINSFGNPIGTWTDNGFPSDFESFISDQFSIALSHEICHTIDFDYLRFNTRLQDWKEAMLSASGTNYNEYLRTKVLDAGGHDFFQVHPIEFFASLANIYFSHSKLSLELAVDRFNKGYKQPINQFLLMADALSSESNSTQFYIIDSNSNLTLSHHSIERNSNGYISKLDLTNSCSIEFTYDSNHFVNTMIIPDLSSLNCGITLSDTNHSLDQIVAAYPNPASNRIIIDYPSNEKITTSLLDIFGRIIYPKSHSKQLNIEHLSSGTYFLLLESIVTGHKTIKTFLKP
ncbi:LamG-like jellyroll fold domain-containing protein [Tamlana sp. 2201CG12-4]|uniref:LamG-like jellyroll fold domain-containing protein n=1 Tax=Tamlana sp. 2201CG12-4 TaxID=3112582 RepID=UPI002DBF4F5D|nr:LamG-like jellyroll fold domain-containing protein [Tamlana sp. 2201CG12-4]MEC3908126.1 LamG-like jellyroll fold domain-containing protein [Tamlana sp. 2201CG12-4]